jgi:hypothetical protein
MYPKLKDFSIELLVLFYHSPCCSSQRPAIPTFANRSNALMNLPIHAEAQSPD